MGHKIRSTKLKKIGHTYTFETAGKKYTVSIREDGQLIVTSRVTMVFKAYGIMLQIDQAASK